VLRIGCSILLFLSFGLTLADDEPVSVAGKTLAYSPRYYPLTVGNKYYYKAYRKDEPEREYQVKAEIKNRQTIDDKEYFYFFAPSEDVRYFVRRDEEGVFMRLVKRRIPLFGLSIDVNLVPELLFLRFPLTVGDTWSQQLTGTTRILLIPIRRTIEGKFQVVDRQVLHTEVGDVDAFVINMSLGVLGGSMETSTFWYGENVGYMKSDAPEDFSELVGYRVFDDLTGTWIDKSPSDKERYK